MWTPSKPAAQLCQAIAQPNLACMVHRRCLQVNISVTKDGVKFSTSGDIGSANITVRQNNAVDKPEEATDIDLNVGCFC